MPRVLPSFESLERRALLAGDDAASICSLHDSDDIRAALQLQNEETCLLEGDRDSSTGSVDLSLRPSGTSKIDHYPESKGWFGDLWDQLLSMIGWR